MSEPMDDTVFDLPDHLHEQGAESAPTFDPIERAALLQSLLEALRHGASLPTTIAALATDHPLPPEVLAALREVVANTGKDEAEILQVFYALLAEDKTAKGLDRAFRSAMRGSILGSRIHRGLRSILTQEVFG